MEAAAIPATGTPITDPSATPLIESREDVT